MLVYWAEPVQCSVRFDGVDFSRKIVYARLQIQCLRNENTMNTVNMAWKVMNMIISKPLKTACTS